MRLKRFLVILSVVFVACSMQAQDRRRFDPKKFEADMEQFITSHAGLTPQESSVFFPLYREMQGKQRTLFSEMRRYRHTNTDDDKVSAEAIEKQDAIDIEIKKIQQQYHQKFMDVLPASKVFKIIRAEEKFHHQAFRRAAMHRRR
jgi:hypothetical protein